MASDDAAMAAVGIPLPVASILGDRGLGVVGLATTAGVAGGIAGMLGLARETPVAIASATRQPLTRPPQGFEERLARIPVPSESGGAQVRVDVWERPDGTRVAQAYVAGTVTFDLGATGEPFDMAGNLAAVAGDDGGSVRAVELALAEAGVDPQTPVQVIGYSQGGAVAARLAESGEWNVDGLLSFGGPTGQIALPADVPAVLVEHTDDVVPALGGTQDNTEALVVERRAYAADEIPEVPPIPAHLRDAYLRTAALMDAASSDAVRDAAARFDAFTADARPVSSTTYEIDRVSARSGPRP
jgi:pimeloyl-ACP methyl ester carboxylesterase